MRQVVVYALYAWCLISLIMLVVYRVRRGRQTDEVATDKTSAPAQSPELLSTDPVDQAPVEQKPVEQKPAEQRAVAPIPVAEPANAVADPKPDLAAQAVQPEPDTVEVPALSAISAAAAGGGSALSETSTTPPTGDIPPGVPATDVPLTDTPVPSATPMAPSSAPKTLADLLSGFQLPHDLLPVIPDHDDITERHVSLMTATAPVEVVGPAVADELERLGFELTPLSENELLAVRDNDRLALTMVTSPTTAEYGGRLMYPQANPGDVVITIEVTDRTV